MNDLTFGATLLSLFVALVGTIAAGLGPAAEPSAWAETAGAPARPAAPLARAETLDCLIVARAGTAH